MLKFHYDHYKYMNLYTPALYHNIFIQSYWFPGFPGDRNYSWLPTRGHLSGVGEVRLHWWISLYTCNNEFREFEFYRSHELLRVPNLGCGSDTPPLTLLKSATPSLWRRKSDTLSLWRRPEPTVPILIREISLWKIFRWRRDSMSTPALSNQWRSPSKQYPKIQ